MGVVQGLTKERMLAIEAACIVAGAVDLSKHLILTKHDGTSIDAGNVAGPQGVQGPNGAIGNQGPAGNQGNQGDPGAQGIQGVQGVAGGAWTKLAETELAAAAASIDFTGISQAYDELELVLYGRGTNAATDVGVSLRMNNDSAANYDWIRNYVKNVSSLTASDAVADTSMAVGWLCSGTAPANAFDMIRMLIPAYKRTVGQKIAVAQGSFKDANTTSNLYTTQASGWWRSTAAINRLTIFPAAGNFAIGTLATLYGRGD